MSLRSFVDSAGHEWQAFDVIPRSEERRRYDRRTSGEVQQVATEDRRDVDRRITVGGTTGIVGADGWLCFERGGDRRRLSPIPDDWHRCDDAQLEAYCRSARPVRRNSVSLQQIRDREP
jgi:hypothetical protein